MSGEYFYGGAPGRAPKRSGKPSQPQQPRGKPETGRITKMTIGQGHGFIRLRNTREVFFHRSDSRDGTPFNDLHIGDSVTFELLEDAVSGARALRVRQRKR